MNSKQLNTLLSFVEPGHRENLHVDAFEDTVQVILNFFDSINKPSTEQNRISWVCNSLPGHGKTTALQSTLLWLSQNSKKRSDKIPVLIALRDSEHMYSLYEQLYKNRPDAEDFVLLVDKENLKDVELDIIKYQVVLITHSRLRNLMLKIGDVNSFLYWHPFKSEDGKYKGHKKRALIIDEMPEFTNGAIFDVGVDDNAVNWFDDCSRTAHLNVDDKAFARGLISTVIAKETSQNPTSVTEALINHIDDTVKERFKEIINRINGKFFSENDIDLSDMIDSYIRYQWFMELLRNDGTGRIERNGKGKSIICSRRIDYRKLTMPILILDGSAHITPLQYNGEYQLQKVKNYNDYSRVTITQKRINTTSRSRKKHGYPVQLAIANDIKELRDRGIQPFPLVAKNDIDVYKKFGVITGKYEQYYKNRSDNSEPLPLNVLNTTGKNHLQNENCIYLTNLPIMKPEYYKQIAISLYDTANYKVNLEFADQEVDRWFEDTHIEKIYVECVVAELVQIVHRGKLRLLNKKEQIQIILATKNKFFVKQLAKKLGISEGTVNIIPLLDAGLYNLDIKVEEMAKRWRHHGLLNEKSFDKCFPCYIGEISANDKRFISYQFNKKDGVQSKNYINKVLSEYNLKIGYEENGWMYVDWLDTETR